LCRSRDSRTYATSREWLALSRRASGAISAALKLLGVGSGLAAHRLDRRSARACLARGEDPSPRQLSVKQTFGLYNPVVSFVPQAE
jgi:hypothetical protein